MKGKKLFSLILGAILCASALFACAKGDTHVHEYRYYTIKQATCTQKGLLEITCLTCGDKSYQETEITGHTYQNGVCTVCGVEINGEPTTPSEPIDFSAFRSFTDIYNEVKALQYVITEAEFFDYIDDTTLSNIYINQSGRLKLTTGDNLELDLGAIRAEGTLPISDKIINEIQIEGGKVSVLYTNGELCQDIANIKEITGGEEGITGLGITTENQFLLRLQDESIISVGTIVDKPTEMSDTVLIYKKIEGGYSVVGALNKGIEELVIPRSHLGVAVKEIAINAFSWYGQLKKSKN